MTFKDGLAAAALYLEATAQDYEQMAHRLAVIRSKTQNEFAQQRQYEDGAKLLRGQAGHIRELKEV